MDEASDDGGAGGSRRASTAFGPDGCRAVVDGGARCGETKNLRIIAEFRRMYEDKMRQIDDIAGGDCVQAKIIVQQEWIKDLTAQNEMLVKVVEDLETEAVERVALLEKKLQDSAKSYGKNEDLLKEKESRIQDLEKKLKPFTELGKTPEEIEALTKKYQDLEKRMLDMRGALTAEVADKHDLVQLMRKEVRDLEEQCRKADQQTHFKDDIIKELRKEIKQLRQDSGDCLLITSDVIPPNPLTESGQKCKCEAEMKQYKEEMLDAKKELAAMKEHAEDCANDRDRCKKELKMVKDELCKHTCGAINGNRTNNKIYTQEDLDNIKQKFNSEAEKIKSEMCRCKDDMDLLKQKKMIEDQQLRTQIIILKKEKELNAAKMDKLEKSQCSRLNAAHKDMLNELEALEEQHRQTLAQLDRLRVELETAKAEHRLCMDRIRDLGKENAQLRQQAARAPCRATEVQSVRPPCKSTGVEETRYKYASSVTTASFHSVDAFTNTITDSSTHSRRDFGSSMARERPTSTTDSGIQCANAKQSRPRDVFTTANCYVDAAPPPRKRDEEVEVVEVLELMGPRSSDAEEPAFCARRMAPSGSDAEDAGFCAQEMAPRRRPQVRDSAAGVETPCLLYSVSRESGPCGVVKVVKSTPMKTQVFDEYFLQTPILCPVPDECKTRSVPFEKPRFRGAPEDLALEDKGCSILCPIDLFPLTAIKFSDALAGTSCNIENALNPIRRVQSAEFSAGGASSLTASTTSYEDTVLSRDQDKVLYVRKLEATWELEHVVQDLNKSAERIIQVQTPDMAAKDKIAQLEAQLRCALKQKEQAVEIERRRRNQEVDNLKQTIQHMEKAIKNKQANSENLQCAVNLYSDSVTVLEDSKQQYETEIAQQQTTIANLQDALVISKRELEELRHKLRHDHDHKCELLGILDIGVKDLELMCSHYQEQLKLLNQTIDSLYDKNLDLEMSQYELHQDIAVLESNLSRYQGEERKLSELVHSLKEEIGRLKYENHADAMKIVGLKNNITFYASQAVEVKDIMRSILGNGDCCSPDCPDNLVVIAQEVLGFVNSLQNQISRLMADVERNRNLERVKESRVDELQNAISLKTLELERSLQMYQDVKAQLDAAIIRNKKLEEAVVELQDHLVDTELDQQFQEQKVDYCHDELDHCLSNLNGVKHKLRMQCQMMTQKIAELNELKAGFTQQSTALEVYKRDLENTRTRYKDEVLELKRVIRELMDKLSMSEIKNKELNAELKNVQEIIVNMTQREGKLQQDVLTKEQDFGNKLQVWKVKESRLLDQIAQLEQQLKAVQNELNGRACQIDSTKCKLQQMANDANMRAQISQEELLAAKNELNCLRQAHECLRMENDSLQKTVIALRGNLGQKDAVNATIKKQLDKCVGDLKRIEADKYFLEQANEKTLRQLERTQEELRERCENIMSMEEELSELKSDREELRRESHHVVCNVRAWLEEQKKLNEELKDRLLEKNALLIKYQRGGNATTLTTTLPPACALENRQRGGAVTARLFDTDKEVRTLTKDSCGLWGLSRKMSDDSDSMRSSICSESAEWLDLTNTSEAATPYDEPGTEIWIQKVESMTEELQRSNRYWKRKISDNELAVTRDK